MNAFGISSTTIIALTIGVIITIVIIIAIAKGVISGRSSARQLLRLSQLALSNRGENRQR